METENTPAVVEVPKTGFSGLPEVAPASDKAAKVDTTAPATSAPVDDAENDSDDGGEATAEPKKKGGFQRRIDRLTQDREDAKAERDHWRELALRTTQPAAPAKTEPKAEGAPKQEDFATYDDYQRAVIRHEARETLKQEREAEEQQKAKMSAAEQEEQTKTKLRSAWEKAAEEFPDFADLASARKIPVSRPMVNALAVSESPSALMYALASNPDEAVRISKLGPEAAGFAMAKLEATATKPPVKRTTSAEPPPKTVGSKSAGSTDPAKMTTSEYRAWRSAGGGTA